MDNLLKTSLLLFCVTYAWASSSNYGSQQGVGGAWESGKTYSYNLTGRSLSGLDDLSNQFSGILLRGKVDISKKSDSVLRLLVRDVQYADVHQNLSNGFHSYIQDKELNYQNFKLNNEPVDVNFKNGAVSSIVVNGNLKEWQVNFLKAVVSLIQVDMNGQNAINSKTTQLPNDKQQEGYFKANEDTVTGLCTTIYTISPVPKYLIQSNPELVPQPNANGQDSKVYQVTKHKNFSDCDSLPRYNFGFVRGNNYEPASNNMGNLLKRASLSTAVITAESKSKWTIQYANTQDTVIIAPNMYNNMMGSFKTRMSLYLMSLSSGSGSSELQKSISNPKKYSNLVYNYAPASPNSHTQSNLQNADRNNNNNNDSENSSSSSSSSSEEGYNNNKGNKNNNNNKNNKFGSNNQGGGQQSNKRNNNNENNYNRHNNANQNANYNNNQGGYGGNSNDNNYNRNNNANQNNNNNANQGGYGGNSNENNDSGNNNANQNNNYNNNQGGNGENDNDNNYNGNNNANQNDNYSGNQAGYGGNRRSRRSVVRDDYNENSGNQNQFGSNSGNKNWNKNNNYGNNNNDNNNDNNNNNNDNNNNDNNNNNDSNDNYNNNDNDNNDNDYNSNNNNNNNQGNQRQRNQGRNSNNNKYGNNQNQGNNKYNSKGQFNGNNNDSSESSSSSSSSENDSNSSSSSSSSGSSSSASSSSSSSSEGSSSSSSSDLSSSEEDWQVQASTNQPPFLPFLPHFIAVEGNSIQASSEVNVVSAVEKLSYQIAGEIYNANSLTQQHTMSRIVLLNRLVETMSSKQMQTVAQQVHVNRKNTDQKNPENVKKIVAWEVFKHAIGNAGTGSALETIKFMIENRMIQGERAAQVISRLPKQAKMPNSQYMELFFSIVKSSTVQQQQSLNSTAIFAFSDLLRMTQVSNGTAYVRYAQHAYGRIAPKKGHSQPIYEKYLPHLEQGMKNAIANNDGHKAHVYIKALGRTAHPQILQAFEDYLEGKKQASHYQRALMVSSFYHLVDVHPHLTRPVLQKIFQNYNEHEEIREIAVNILIASNPSAETFQMLALSTHREPSRGVKSAIITGIQSAANLQTDSLYSPASDELARNAQSAVDLLKSKNYGFTSSKSYYFNLEADDVDIVYENRLNMVRSKNHFFPQNVFMSVQSNAGGIYEEESYFEAMTSTVNQLLKKLNSQFQKRNRYNQNDNNGSASAQGSRHPWNADKISKNLGIKIPSAPEVEMTFVAKLFGGQRIFALGNSSVESIPQAIKNKYNEFKNSPMFEFTSVHNDAPLQIGFPSPMGFPFLYSYSRPVVVHMHGEAKPQTHPDIEGGSHDRINVPQQFNLTIDFDATYAIHTDSKFGMIAPFNHHEYTSGVVKNLEFNAAFKAEMGADTDSYDIDIRLRPSNKNAKQVLFEYNTVPYTSKYNVLNIKPALEQSSTERVHYNDALQVNQQFGKKYTGIALQYNAMSENPDADEHFFDFSIFNFNRMSSLPFPLVKRGVHPNHVQLVYDPNQSSAQAVNINFGFKYQQHGTNANFGSGSGSNWNSNSGSHSGSGSSSNSGSHSGSSSSSGFGSSKSGGSAPNFQEAIPSASSENYRARQQELFNKVSAGIPEPDTYLFDFSAQIEHSGQSNSQVVATAAMASSDVSPFTRALFYYGLNQKAGGKSSSGDSYEVCASTKGYFPRVPEIDMQDALKSNPNSTFQANIAFGHNCNSGYHFETQAILAQSEDYRESLEQNNYVKFCKHQMQQGDYLSDVCQNATQAANELDYVKLFFNFNWDSNSASNKGDSSNYAGAESQLFAPLSVWLGKLGIDYVYKNKQSSGTSLSPNKVEAEIQWSENNDYVNFTVYHGSQETQFSRAYFYNDLQFQPYEIANWMINSIRKSKEDYMDLPSCSLNERSVSTFDNSTFPMQFNNDWYTIFVHTPKQINAAKYLADRDSEVNYYSKYDNMAIIARGGAAGKEVHMMMGDNYIELQPSGQSGSHSGGSYSDAGNKKNPAAHVTVNGQKVSFSSDNSYTASSQGEIAVKVYANPNGEVTVKSQLHGITLRYDGHYVDIYASGYYKTNVRGICGTYDDNKYNDFTTPRNCVVRQPNLFAASYALAVGSPSSSVQAEQRAAANAACYKPTFQYANVISEAEAGRAGAYGKNRNSNSQSSGSRSSYRKYGNSQSTSCTNNQVKYIEYQDQNTVCFSVHPIPQCRNGCQPTNTFNKEEPFVCMEKRDNAKYWMNEIDNGNRVNFSKHQPNKQIQVEVPASCQKQN